MKIKEFVFRRHTCEQLEQRAMLTTFVVDTLSDIVDAQDNRTSLREAVLSANENPGEDEIRFADRVTGRLLLQNGELAISDSVRIVGPGAHLLTIDALGNDPTPQDANGDGSPAFAVVRERREPYSRFHLSDVTVTGADGGAMSLSLGSLSHVVVEGNSGGAVGIANPITPVADGEDDWFHITDSVFRNNSRGTGIRSEWRCDRFTGKTTHQTITLRGQSRKRRWCDSHK